MTDRLYIGVDLGLDGALVALGSGGVEIVPMPVLSSSTGRRAYDGPRIVSQLEEWRELADADLLVTAEALQAMPFEKGGSIANFQRGFALGFLQGVAAALRLPIQLVQPRTWQKAMFSGTAGRDTKQRAILAAQRLFPEVSLKRTPRCKTLHDGIADAILLAEFGRRTQNHQAQPVPDTQPEPVPETVQ